MQHDIQDLIGGSKQRKLCTLLCPVCGEREESAHQLHPDHSRIDVRTQPRGVAP